MELPPVISFDVAAELITQLPTPQAAFICNPDGRGIVKAFLSQYFAIYDSGTTLLCYYFLHEYDVIKFFVLQTTDWIWRKLITTHQHFHCVRFIPPIRKATLSGE